MYEPQPSEPTSRITGSLPLRGAFVFPGMIVPLQVGRDKSVHAIDDAANSTRLVMLCNQKDINQDQPRRRMVFIPKASSRRSSR